MAAFDRFEVACGKARRFQNDTGEKLTRACLVEGQFYFPHFDNYGPWTHMTTFDVIVSDHRKREIARCIANSISQMRRVERLQAIDVALEA